MRGLSLFCRVKAISAITYCPGKVAGTTASADCASRGAIISRDMNLLSLIIIFLALVIVGSIAFIAWEVTSERMMPRSDAEAPRNSRDGQESPGSTKQS